VPTQSLFLLNSDFIKEAAQAIAKSTLTATDRDDAARVRDIYLKLFGRPPSEAETVSAAEYLNSLGAADAAQRETAWTEYCRALLISAEFLYRR
jgi:hypothetical protein